MTVTTSSNSQQIEVIDGLTPSDINEELVTRDRPVLLKGLVSQWPLVHAGLTSNEHIIDALKQAYNGKLAGAYYGDEQANGRYGYKDDLTRCNFEVHKTPLNDFLDELAANFDSAQPPSRYIASNLIDQHFPDLRKHNDLNFDDLLIEGVKPRASIWIGNHSLVPCHFDASNNIACCVAGKRRFTLFSPEQIEGLYPGPLEPTPGGQVISMVDFEQPDLTRYPKFANVVEHKLVADMQAGDALFIPSLWWHQVEALSAFNVLVNYWWESVSPIRGQASDVLTHAIMSLRDLPQHQKDAWKAIFDYYVFNDAETPRAHLPQHAHGELGDINDNRARRIRAKLINKLNR
jgi:hypothetical protein